MAETGSDDISRHIVRAKAKETHLNVPAFQRKEEIRELRRVSDLVAQGKDVHSSLNPSSNSNLGKTYHPTTHMDKLDVLKEMPAEDITVPKLNNMQTIREMPKLKVK